MQKKVKLTIEYDGKTEVYEAFSLMATIIEYPHDAPVQGVTTVNTGR